MLSCLVAARRVGVQSPCHCTWISHQEIPTNILLYSQGHMQVRTTLMTVQLTLKCLHETGKTLVDVLITYPLWAPIRCSPWFPKWPNCSADRYPEKKSTIDDTCMCHTCAYQYWLYIFIKILLDYVFMILLRTTTYKGPFMHKHWQMGKVNTIQPK